MRDASCKPDARRTVSGAASAPVSAMRPVLACHSTDRAPTLPLVRVVLARRRRAHDLVGSSQVVLAARFPQRGPPIESWLRPLGFGAKKPLTGGSAPKPGQRLMRPAHLMRAANFCYSFLKAPAGSSLGTHFSQALPRP